MRTIVIGDIHGCYKELVEMIETLKADGKYNKGVDRLIFLGDYIDRGEDSSKVIKYIRELQKNNDNVIALMGNHEDMCIQYHKEQWGNTVWFENGGYDTLMSYNDQHQLLSDVEWMKHLPLYYEDDNFIYVHAGVNVYKPIDEQNRFDLLWIREEFICSATPYEKKVVFGHTPAQTLKIGNKPFYTFSGNIGIDTACVYGGCLTALIIDDDKVSGFYQIEKEVKEQEEVTVYGWN